MKKTTISRQIDISFNADDMSNETLVVAKVPPVGGFDIDNFVATLEQIKKDREIHNPTNVADIKRLIDFDGLSQAAGHEPKNGKAQGPVQRPVRFSSDYYHLRMYRAIVEIEELSIQVSSKPTTETMNKLIALSVSVGRLLKETELRSELLKYVSTGKKIRLGLDEKRNRRSSIVALETKQRLDCMQELVDQGKSITNAAKLAADKGIGPSKEANKKLYHRHKKTGTSG